MASSRLPYNARALTVAALRASSLALAAAAASCGGEAGPPPLVHEWRVDAEGIGRIRAGMTVADAEAAAGVMLRGDERDEACGYLRPAPGPEGVLVMVRDGRVARIDVVSAGVPTEAGIEVGSTAARVHDAYADVTASPHKYTDGEYLTVASDAGHRLVFETDGDRVTRYRSGRLPEVEWVEGCA